MLRVDERQSDERAAVLRPGGEGGQAVEPDVAAEATADRNNAFAWFNMGTNFVALDVMDRAAVAYDEARRVGLPWRMLWYTVVALVYGGIAYLFVRFFIFVMLSLTA